jgi:hypothetical protein
VTVTEESAMAESAGTTTTPLNLFLSHSPFQYFVACHMVSRMPEFREGQNYLVVDSIRADVRIHTPEWHEVIVCDPPVGGSVIGAAQRMRPVLDRVFDLFDSHRPARLFLANVQWPLNNLLRAALVRKKYPTSIEICNYPEGIGSFRLVYANRRQRFRDRLKGVLGLISGVRYQPLQEDLMGLEMSTKIYSMLPQLLPLDLQAKAVAIPPFPMSQREVDRHTCIFLGQNDRLLPSHLRRPLAVAAAAYCRRLPYERFLFKSHHYGESDIQREAFIDAGFEILSDTRPVEQILMADPVACVVSFTSSALVHLKMMFGHQIRCVAYFVDEYDQLTRQKCSPQHSVRTIFKQSGVEILTGDVIITPKTSV